MLRGGAQSDGMQPLVLDAAVRVLEEKSRTGTEVVDAFGKVVMVAAGLLVVAVMFIRWSRSTYFAELAQNMRASRLLIIERPATERELESHTKQIVCTEGDQMCQAECSICIEAFVADQVARRLECGHTFHKECVDTWLLERSRLCPFCKAVVGDEEGPNKKDGKTDPAKEKTDLTVAKAVPPAA